MTLKDIFSYSRVAVKEAKVVSKEWGRVSTWADAGIVRKGGAHLIGLKLVRLGDRTARVGIFDELAQVIDMLVELKARELYL
jgi:hypothetical protein